MELYRRKPTVVEAEQWFPGKSVEGVYGQPNQGMCPCYRVGAGHNDPHVMTTHEQILYVSPGDWIIKEPDGSGYYLCKDATFSTLYESVK